MISLVTVTSVTPVTRAARLLRPEQRSNHEGHTPASSLRMQQFFDHYLMDAPSPVWMVKGVPAVLKGKTFGLELVGDTVRH